MLIATTHKNTDFDALAAVIGATLLYPGCVGVVPKQTNPNVSQFLSTHKTAFSLILPHEIDHPRWRDGAQRFKLMRTAAQIRDSCPAERVGLRHGLADDHILGLRSE